MANCRSKGVLEIHPVPLGKASCYKSGLKLVDRIVAVVLDIEHLLWYHDVYANWWYFAFL